MNDIAYFDPLLLKCPKGTIAKGKSAKIKLYVNKFAGVKEVYLMIKHDDENDYFYEEMHKINPADFAKNSKSNQCKIDKKHDALTSKLEKDGECGLDENIEIYEKTINFSRSGHFWFNFKLNFDGYSKYVSKTFDTRSCVQDYKGEDFLQLVTEKEYASTNSMQGGIIYQIFVDRFCKVGEVKPRPPLVLREDWGGAIKKNTTNPILINEEVFGGNFKGITSKLDYLKSLGVTVIYMCPISEAYSNHKYDTANYMNIDDMFGSEADFKELVDSAKAKGIQIVIDGVYNHTGSDSIYFNKTGRYKELGAYQSKDSKYYSWYDFIEYPNKYEAWWGIDTLPKVKGTCTEFQEYIAGNGGVIEKFMKLGIGGVRLDVVDELSNEFVKKIASKVKEFGENKVIMGEVWEDAGTKIAYSSRRKYFAENELNSVMNYPVKESLLSYIKTGEPFDLVSTLRMIQNNYPKAVQDNLMNFLTTHDTVRFRSELSQISNGDEEVADKLMKLASTISYTVMGVPSIFYGDEYGMKNNDGSSRGCFDWNNYQNDTLLWYQKLAEVRKFEAIKNGELNIILARSGKFVFERFNNNERIVIITNMKGEDLKINLNGEFESFITGEKPKQIVVKKHNFEILIEKKQK